MGVTICGCTPVRKKRSHTVFVLLWLLLAFTSALASEMNEGFDKVIIGDVHMKEFLQKQFGKVKVELTKNFVAWSGTQVNRFKRDSANPRIINVTAEIIWKSELLSSNISGVDNDFFNVGDSLIQVIDDSNNLTVNSFSIKKIGITAPVISSINIKDIMFSKVFQWNGVQIFLLSTKTAGLVVLTSTIDLFNTSSSFKQQQIINHPSFRESYAVDGEIFTHNNQLYMFLIFGSESHEKVNAVLYKWQNTYFDVEIEGVLTEGAIDVSSFNYGSSVILVVIQSGLQKENAAEKISSSLVLKFSSKEKRKPSLERIHYLPTKNPLSIISFQYFSYDYILISERDTSSSIYWWEGGEFIEWLVVPQLKGMKVLVYNSTLLLAYQNSVIYMYVMSWKDLERINELRFDGEIISVSVNSTRLIVLVNNNEYSEIFVVKLTMENFQDDPISNNSITSSSIIVNYSPLSKCYDNLEMELSKGQDKLKAVNKNLTTLLLTDGSAIINEIKVASKNQPTSNVTISKGYFSNIEGEFPISEDGRTSHKSLDRLLNDSSVFLQRVKHKNEQYYKHNFDVTFKGDLYVDKLNMNSLVAKTINGQIIGSENLISLSEEQSLMNVTVNSVETNWLVAKSFKTKHVDDLVLNNHFNDSTWIKSRNISSIGVRSLTCFNVIFNNINDSVSINDINLNDLVLVRDGINISRLTKFGTVEADKITLAPLDFDRFNRIYNKVISTANEDIEAESIIEAKENIIINHLNVKRINGIQIDKEILNLVTNGAHNIIYGDIHFMVPFKAKRSVFKHAFKSGKDGLSSVSINWSVNPDSRSVYNSNMKESLRKKRVDGGGVDVDVGERQPEELLNIFNGKLNIDGCVQVNEIVFDNCTLIIGNKTIPIMNLANEYWLHHGNQNISTVVKFNGPGGVTINNNLESVSSINGINIDANQFLQIVSNQSKDIHSSISFRERTVIYGNVFVSSNLTNDFEKLNKFVKISSMIENIENLKGSHSDDIKPRTNVTNEDSQLHPHKDFKCSGTKCSIKKNKVKVFGNIKVRGNIVTDEVDSLNFTNVKDKYMKKLTNLKFSEVKAKNLIVKKLNNVSVEDEIIHYNTDNATHKFINKLSIDASLLLLDIKAQKINDINIFDTFPEVVNGSERNVIKGRKRVRGINIDHGLRTENINNISMEKLFGPSMYLSRSKPQNINATVHLNSVKMDVLKTEFINGINTSSFIDTNSEEIILQSSEVIFQKLFVHGNVISSQFQRGCLLPVINNTDGPLSFENAREYITVNTTGNVTWNTKYNYDKGRIQKLFEEAVTFNGIQNITGSVKFNHLVTAENVNATKTVAGVNMTHIISDALLKNKPGQIISGEIVFVKDVTCSSATLQNEVIIPTVNSVNITELNEKVIRKNSKSDNNRLVSGYKYFKNGFKSEHLNTNGGNINGTQTRNIASLDNVLSPHLIFYELEIFKDLKTTKINHIDLDEFLSDRIPLQYKFGEDLPMMNSDLIFNDHIKIAGESIVEGLLNNIHTDHLIMRSPYANDKTLYGCKTFEKNLTADGEFNLDTINNKNISKVYNSSVLYGGTSSKFCAANVEFKGTVEMKSTSIQGSSFKVKDTEMNFLNEIDQSPTNFLLGND